MKILLFYAPSFWYKPFEKNLPEAPDAEGEATVEDVVTVFYQLEEQDVENRSKILTKFIKNIKWLAGKFETRRVMLHSFGHLSMSKAPADFAREFIDEARARLENVDYTVYETPFGYFNEWKLHCAGESLAKVFKDL